MELDEALGEETLHYLQQKVQELEMELKSLIFTLQHYKALLSPTDSNPYIPSQNFLSQQVIKKQQMSFISL